MPTASTSDSASQIIIIGSGIAGLACAADLVRAGQPVRILEARNRIGGRTYTDTTSLDGFPIDLGARYLVSVLMTRRVAEGCTIAISMAWLVTLSPSCQRSWI